ncbi:hypothetical protein [Rhizobium sp. 768_B6_N1_8]|uniref:hypothetical protein n=1 Tax=unclassified Rhizobium TaxID=2613769 RepID=UPI003F276792
MDGLIEFLEREISSNTTIVKGIEEDGDKWSRNHGDGTEDVTAATLAEAKRKIREAGEHLARLRR